MKTLNSASQFLKRHFGIIIAFAIILAATAATELWLGRSLFGPDGKFGWWEGNIWSGENSQRLADPYSFSHIAHGILLYALLWLTARKIPVRYRFLIASIIEACWELMENSPLIINRYRAVTISLGYVGDSVINSLSDILMLAIGFLFTYHVKPRIALIAVLLMEIACAFWVRDNLTLNIIMLIHPIDTIKHWQMEVAPLS